MISHTDKQQLLNVFPNIKLSYENITHKKVLNSDYIVAIPEGKKCFAWFTSVNNKMVCLIMELTNNKQIDDIKITNACFSSELSYGTILYGTVFYSSKNKFFSIEDIFCYKGNDIERMCWGEKLIKINNILKKDLKQISYNNSFIVFGMPLICKTKDELERKIKDVDYKIQYIQFVMFGRINNYLIMDYKKYILDKPNERENTTQLHKNPLEKIPFKNEMKREIVFNIRPDIQDDIYRLYCLNNELKEEEHGIAHISDYKTSVMMNRLFRIIKENENLDALEESDDEEEFENVNIDKFVNLNKSCKMICHFNHKFKRWVPINLANEEYEIIKNKELDYIYKTHEQKKITNQGLKYMSKKGRI
jgi:hypothetical protein